MDDDAMQYLHRLPCENEEEAQKIQGIAKQYDPYAWIDGTDVKLLTDRRLLFADQQNFPSGVFNDQFV